VVRRVDTKGRQREEGLFLKWSVKVSNSTILPSNLLSFNCTILASVLNLCPSSTLILVSSKYFFPRATDIQTDTKTRRKRKNGEEEDDEGRTKTFKSLVFGCFCHFLWIRKVGDLTSVILTTYRKNCL